MFGEAVRHLALDMVDILLNQGLSFKAALDNVHESFGIYPGTVRRWIDMYFTTGSCAPHKRELKLEGVVRMEHLDFAKALLVQNSTHTNKELCVFLFDRFNVAYTEDQVKHAIADAGYTRKVTSKIMQLRNERLREYWQDNMQASLEEIPAYMYVVIDESHLSPEELERRYGRSPKGYPAFVKSRLLPDDPNGLPTQSCSCIAAISIEGMLSVTTLKINDHQTFLRALEGNVLPLMNPFPAEKSILMMDNASPHLKADVINLCDAFGVMPLFLPPYSYDFSPIEPVFHLAKDYIRRKWGIRYAYCPLEQQLNEALWSCCPPNVACNEFTHVGITVQPWERAWACRGRR
jgi:transposase